MQNITGRQVMSSRYFGASGILGHVLKFHDTGTVITQSWARRRVNYIVDTPVKGLEAPEHLVVRGVNNDVCPEG